MTYWSKMNKRSKGLDTRIEDRPKLYDTDYGVVKTGDYKDFFYEIGTTGKYPFIRMTTGITLAGFYGYGSIVLRMTNGLMEINRYPHPFDHLPGDDIKSPGKEWKDSPVYTDGPTVTFVYQFNKDGDYVEGGHSGKKYRFADLEKLVLNVMDNLLKFNSEQLDKRSKEEDIKGWTD